MNTFFTNIDLPMIHFPFAMSQYHYATQNCPNEYFDCIWLLKLVLKLKIIQYLIYSFKLCMMHAECQFEVMTYIPMKQIYSTGLEGEGSKNEHVYYNSGNPLEAIVPVKVSP